MKLQTLSIGIVVLAVLAAVAWWASQPSKPGEPDSLLSADLIEETHRIELTTTTGSGPVQLEKGTDGTWTLPDYHHLPVDLAKLARLTQSLQEARIERLVTQNPERLERLELGRASITFFDESGEPVWNLETGKRGPAGGTFFRMNEEESAYLTDQDLTIDGTLKNWADKHILPFDGAAVQSVTAPTADGKPVTFTREARHEPFTSEDTPENHTVQNAAVVGLANRLASLRFTDLVDATEDKVSAALKKASNWTIATFDGDTFSLTLARPEKDDEEASTPPAYLTVATGKEDSPWASFPENLALEISASSAETLILDRNDVFQEDPGDESGDQQED